ncbi:MAG: hypothetical protein ACTHKK_04305, partial [Candidatus Nitrosocosmicus sp.]
MSSNNINSVSINKDVGPDGVLQIYPTYQKDGTKGTTFFMNMSLEDPTDDPCFDYDGINYDPKKGDPVSTERKVKDNFIYYTAYAPYLEYHSDHSHGNSLRLGIYASIGSKGKKQKYTWRDTPDYLYDEKGIRN